MSPEMRRLLTLVQESYRERRDVEFYASRLGVSRGSLNRLCRQELGISSKRVITGKIVARAEELLLEEETQSVASTLGFQDSDSFRRFFKRHSGVTASEYRNNGRTA